MERLSGLDASFLYLETPEQLMHVCGLLLLDVSTMPGGYDFATLKAEIARRVSGVPAFRHKLRHVPFDLDHPVWVDDPDFDIDRHVYQMALPSPGDTATLEALCGELAGIPLKRSRPLWEMAVIEGLADGRVAVFTKMHHAGVDGVSGAGLIAHLCTLEPELPPVGEPALRAEETPEPGALGLFGRGLANALVRPARLVGMVRPTTELVARTVSRARQGTAMAAPLTAPRTSFNGTIGAGRVVAFADLPLERIKQVKRHIEGATVNDVVLALSGGALRRYLIERGELPEQSLLASVPVSVHETSLRSGGSNKVSSLFARLGTDLADPLARVSALAASNRNAKEHHKAIPADTLQDWAEFAAPRLFGFGVRMVAGLRLAERGPVIHNLVISNVPGPPIPMYFMGALIDGLYPFGPIFHGAGLNITVMSQNGMVHIGLIGCRRALGDLDELAACFAEELDALENA